MSVYHQRIAQNYVLSLFEIIAWAGFLKTLLEGTELRSMQKEKEWSGWDLNSTAFFP
jgi:hypothetical protein